MTDLEISTALAKAIGWKFKQLGFGVHHTERCVGIPEQLAQDSGETRTFYDEVNGNGWCVVFDYRDWNVASPIAVRLDRFPIRFMYERKHVWGQAYQPNQIFWDSAQEAIAMSVIQSKGIK